MGCDYAQGFLFTQPLPPEEFTAWLQAWRSSPKG
jgi:EAL domain-containing protein (putative c-di-GMP-specific phosphodiesterase class I)